MTDVSTEYEHLTVDTVAAYVAANDVLTAAIDPTAIVKVEEVGDGNLNLVFILRDSAGRGLVLKQALPYVRLVGRSWPMTPERARIEAETTIAHRRLDPSHLPRIHLFDPERYVIAMEDLSDHVVWRTALNRSERQDGVAEDLGIYVANVAFGTSVFGMDAEGEKLAVGRAINPELCRITEDLVFTEPYVDAGRNRVLPANEPDARELANDAEMVRQMGWAKWQFMTQAEALIHGDLHTGSVMVRGDAASRSTKVIDSEFSFYGPVGFDLGALWANYVIAAARACALGDSDRAAWCLSLLAGTWDAFEAEFRRIWPQRRDPRVFTDRTLDDYLAKVRLDTAGFAAAKAARRIVGLAKASDIETLDEGRREGAARGVLLAARMLATVRHSSSDPVQLAARVGDLLDSNRTR